METKEDIFQTALPKLFGLAYRLLGTLTDAEDLVQDAWLTWNATDSDIIRDPQAWLVTVVTRLEGAGVTCRKMMPGSTDLETVALDALILTRLRAGELELCKTLCSSL